MTNVKTDTELVNKHSPTNMATHEKLPGVQIYLTLVTPELAEEMLDLNIPGQRKISPGAIEKYASDMAVDAWVFNGAPILITDQGQLIDGQHRLNAIMESGESQVLLIVIGVSVDAMDTVDTNRRRSYSDMLAMRGVKNHAMVAAIASGMWHWMHGNYGGPNIGRVANARFTTSTPSNSAKDLWMEKVEAAYSLTYEQAAAFAVRIGRNYNGITPATWGMVWIILSAIDKDLREKFFWELELGRQPGEISQPVMALMRRLARVKSRERISRTDQLDMLFKVFNAWQHGKQIGTLSPPRPPRFDTVALPEGWVELEDK